MVVLFDTSASQAGEFRTEALKTLKDALANLAAGDRVQLLAVDLNAIPLTKAFAAPNSPEMADALKKLEARVPLGSTDMQTALSAAADSFSGDAKNSRAVVYIGDGMSTANLLGTARFGSWAPVGRRPHPRGQLRRRPQTGSPIARRAGRRQRRAVDRQP